MPTMLARYVLLLAVLGSPIVIACMCHGDPPIQQTNGNHANQAVFTARLLQGFGRIYNFKGRRYYNLALVSVGHRYWNVPWYWPPVVLLDGGIHCAAAFPEGELLVSGHPSGYGVLEVSGCGRTRPLSIAQVDLRTLDGSRCAGPGGTLIGRLTYGPQHDREGLPAKNMPLIFFDSLGRAYATVSDRDGVFEIRNLPPDEYKLHPTLTLHPGDLPLVVISEGVCSDASVSLRP